MKIALLGTGKTGSQVMKALRHDDNNEIFAFNSSSPVTKKALEPLDVVISFLTGDVFLESLPLLLESSKPMVVASTGFSWPKDIDQQLKEKKISWIYSSNFSTGIYLKKQLIKTINQFQDLYDGKIDYHLHEVHHLDKKDAPSGTALSLAGWLSDWQDKEISYAREKDVKGLHELTIHLDGESLRLSHHVEDRILFAKGALWAARLLDQTSHGLHQFYDVLDHLFTPKESLDEIK